MLLRKPRMYPKYHQRWKENHRAFIILLTIKDILSIQLAVGYVNQLFFNCPISSLMLSKADCGLVPLALTLNSLTFEVHCLSGLGQYH